MNAERRLVMRDIARVEGEGKLDISIRGDTVENVALHIYEPPRFFEALLRGRDFREAPDITSRICGICPVAYQVSACNALEQLCGVHLDDGLRDLRRLLYCGEWIASHVLHIHFLHAPDFYGLADAIEIAKVDRVAVERGLSLKKAGNAILDTVGGRSIHPVNVRVGGFYRTPTVRELRELGSRLRAVLDDAVATVQWAAAFEFPEIRIDHATLALHRPHAYAIDNGSVWNGTGPPFSPALFESRVRERQVETSTALYAEFDGTRYLTGPMSRYSLNSGQLGGLAAETASSVGLEERCDNPFRSIVVRALEVLYAIEEALRLIDRYERPVTPFIECEPRAGVGYGVSEAPRGLLYHRYEVDTEGAIVSANIIPPTSQNQSAIEHDLRAVIADSLGSDDAALTALCERTVRNYDPCISCSAHFLDTSIIRR